MTAAVYDIQIEQGATFRFPKFQFGTLLVDFTGCKFRLQMRKSKKTTAEVYFTVTSEDSDGGITADANGNIIIVVPDEKTDAAKKDGYWDLKCYNPDQTEDRLIEGIATINLATTADAAP
jgi:hypothetical protein